VQYNLNARFGLALAYEHAALGSIDTGVQATGTARVRYAADTAWLSLRMTPVRANFFAMGVELAAGAGWQSAQASGAVWSELEPDKSREIQCTGCDSAAPALRVGVFVEGRGIGSLRPALRISFDNYAFSDELLDNCVIGGGSAQTLQIRLGVASLWLL
jgi:hypothetical protein